MKQQTGYLFHRGQSWFLRYYDTDAGGESVEKWEKMKVAYGGAYKTRRSVQPFIDEILAPLNSGLLNPQATMTVTEFVDTIYLPQYVKKNLRAASIKQYTDVYENHLQNRLGKLTLRSFRTVHGEQITVRQSVWNSFTNEPKTKKRRAPVPVVKQLAEALETHRLRSGILAQPNLPIFQGNTGKPLNLDNLVKRAIVPALSLCVVCKKREDEHKPEGHIFERDNSLPRWHGWHAFRRGLATNLHALGVDDKTIQAILRHSNIGITHNIYIKSVNESHINALAALSENLGICNDHATRRVIQ